jgi:general secretion pathway protein K
MMGRLAVSRGVALIAVLWLVAAMSLITAGIVQSVRGEIRATGLQRQSVVALGVADAAILLALQSVHAQSQEATISLQKVVVEFENVQYEVLIESLNGRIDINSASPALLASLYTHAGGLSTQAAQNLAQSTVDAREAKNSRGERRNFGAVEDLLGVSQMTYDLYAKLTGLVTADVLGGSGRVNLKAAPIGVLHVLTGGNAVRAVEFAAQRDANPNLMDTSSFDPAFIDAAPSPSMQLQVLVRLEDVGAIHRAWHVYWGADPRSGIPWRVLAKMRPTLRMEQAQS